MALPASGLITLAQIGFEAGITQPYTLTKLYGKMGAPASGFLSLTHFYGKSNAFTLNIATSVANPDIHALAIAAGWNGTGPLIVNFNCPYVNSLRLDGSKTFPGGLALNIMSGCLVGGVVNSGTALYTRVPVSVYGGGTLAGGGGAGGGGGTAWYRWDSTSSAVTAYGGNGGAGQGFPTNAAITPVAATSGGAGRFEQYSGDMIGGQTASWAKGGGGGVGGNWGGKGAWGEIGYANKGSGNSAGSSGGSGEGDLGGLYVDGNSFVTWGALGSRLGRAAN